MAAHLEVPASSSFCREQDGHDPLLGVYCRRDYGGAGSVPVVAAELDRYRESRLSLSFFFPLHAFLLRRPAPPISKRLIRPGHAL